MTIATHIPTQKNFKLFVVFMLVMLSSFVFAKTNTSTVVTATNFEVSICKETTININLENTIASMDFAIWFMGSKKTTNNTSNGSFSKKQLINSGINTNSVLIRSFLKKVNTQENGVA